MLRTLLLLLLACCVGCGSGQSVKREPAKGTKKGPDETYRIAVIPKGLTHEFWQSVHFGAEKAAKELGNVEVIWQGPHNESNTAEQISMVEAMITKRVDGIVLAPIDSQGLIEPVQKANANNIPVVVFDSGLDDEEIIVSYVATDNYNAGAMAGKHLGELLNGEGNIVLLRYKVGSESTTQREEGFLDAIKKFEGINILSSDQYSGTTPRESIETSENLLQTHGDEVDGIFTVCEPNTLGMLDALESHQMAKDVKFIGFDPAPRFEDAMQEGKIDGIMLQDPVQMGYLAVKTVVAHLNGESVEKRISTGEYLATPENFKEERYQELLHPMQQR